MRFRVAFKTDDPEVIRMMEAPGRSETVARALESYALLRRMEARLAVIEEGVESLLCAAADPRLPAPAGNEAKTAEDDGVGLKVDRLMERLGRL